MTSITRKSIAGIIVAAVAFLAYYGTYLPYHKSEVFIETIRGMSGARSVEEFKKMFSMPLDIPSPSGQEELVRNMASEITGFVGRGTTSPEIEEDVIAFVERYFDPIIQRGKGMSFGQDLYILGTLQRIAYQHSKKAEHLVAAEKYFIKGLELGPRRPQFLYGLLDLSIIGGNGARVGRLAEQIHAQWPTDARVSELLRVLSGVASSTKATSTKNTVSSPKPKQ